MALRFGWIGDSRRAALRTKVGACLQAWRADWCVAHDDGPAHVEEAPIVPYSPDEAFVLQAGAGAACVMVAIARDELVRLGNWLAGVLESTAALSQEVARAALEDLTRRIGELAGEGEVWEHGQSAWPQSLSREELGAVGLTFNAGSVAVTLALARDAVDVVCPAGPAAAGPVLHARADAADVSPVRLTAGFEFGTISMRELADLRVGEVLVGECPLDTPVRVLAPGRVPLGHARMGRIGGRLAVALTQHPTSQENV